MPQALSHLLWACGKAEHWDERLFDMVAARVVANRTAVGHVDLGNFAWGLGKAFSELASQGCSTTVKEKAIKRYLSENPVRLKVLSEPDFLL